ncbi:MAG TPA: hypothetical protein VFR62_03135 [Gemmatimonadales bacterium]|nr:hypothetical protein [Gemmatimonadales bacterium]
MEGPMDATGGAPERTRAGTETGGRGRPPGGKALQRLLYFLEERGYEGLADAAIESAADRDGAGLRERAEQFAARPVGGRAEAAGDPRRAGAAVRARGARRGAAESTEAAPAPGSGGEAAVEVARVSMAAAETPPMGPPTATGPHWRSLGPWTIPNGQTYGASRVNVSGRISCVAIDPGNPSHVLVGAANGGVWETFDRGGSWAPRTDYAATLTVGAIAFDPRNPATVYCGTGEGNWWSFLGAGILRSTNGGTTWSPHCTAPFVGQGFYDLLIDPADSRFMYAATTGGLYTSRDGGVTWTLRRAVRTWSLAMAPAGGAGAEILAACADGLFRSTNRGNAWAAVALPGSPGGFARLATAISPLRPAVAYAWGASGSTAYLWRRAQGTWTAVAPPPGVNVNQAWYDWFLAISPDRPGQIYCGAIEVHRGELAPGGIWTWTNLTNKGASGDSIHPDQHAIAFEPGQPNTIYVGNDGGMYLSLDRGITWQHRNNGLVITEFEYIAQDYGASRWLIGGTQDNGTERWTGSAVWDHIADGDGGDCGVNRTTPDTCFHTYFGMSPERSTSRGNFGTWAWLPPPVPAGEGSLFYPPFECSTGGGDTVAIGGDATYVSRNNMTTWTRLAHPVAARASALAIPNANTVYVGALNGQVYRTTWNGSAWNALAALTTPRAGAVVSDILVDPNNANRIWVTYRTVGGGRVYRSDDGGTTWTDRTAGLPNLPINAIEVDPWNGNRAWVAADLGVYQTWDGGASWTDFSSALPNAYVGDLLFHPHARVLRAGLRNRGVWEVPVDGWMTAPICGRQFEGTLAANQTQRWFTWGWPAPWHMVWTVMPTSPLPGGPQITWKVQLERANAEFVTYWITVQNLTATPVRFEGRYCILSRY